jgi:hypothetical protein
MVNGCDTDALYVFAYKKCPYVPIVTPDLSAIDSESVKMRVLFDQGVVTLEFDKATWNPLLWADCGAFYY